MQILIAVLAGLFVGGISVSLLALMRSESIQDVIQRLCANCTENKRKLIVKTLQNDVDWVDMDDDEIANIIIEALYGNPGKFEEFHRG